MPSNKLKNKYDELLQQFKATLRDTSYSSDTGNQGYVVSSMNEVVNFDSFKKSVCRTLNAVGGCSVQEEPKSCDALHRCDASHWFLIEFKMGNIDKRKLHEIRGKILESLLLLTEQLEETIAFTRLHCTFILVYNLGRQKINSALNRLHDSNLTPLRNRLYCLKQLYFHNVCIYTPQEFEREFVNKCFP